MLQMDNGWTDVMPLETCHVINIEDNRKIIANKLTRTIESTMYGSTIIKKYRTCTWVYIHVFLFVLVLL